VSPGGGRGSGPGPDGSLDGVLEDEQKAGHEAETIARGGEDSSVGSKWCEGYALLDPLGQSLGRVERIFRDGDGGPRYVRVRAGLFANRLVLIPVRELALNHEKRTVTLR